MPFVLLTTWDGRPETTRCASSSTVMQRLHALRVLSNWQTTCTATIPNWSPSLEKHLVGELAFWFGEELKADRPESNRAWHAFQRLLLDGLQTALTDMRAEQQETKQPTSGSSTRSPRAAGQVSHTADRLQPVRLPGVHVMCYTAQASRSSSALFFAVWKGGDAMVVLHRRT